MTATLSQNAFTPRHQGPWATDTLRQARRAGRVASEAVFSACKGTLSRAEKGLSGAEKVFSGMGDSRVRDGKGFVRRGTADLPAAGSDLQPGERSFVNETKFCQRRRELPPARRELPPARSELPRSLPLRPRRCSVGSASREKGSPLRGDALIERTLHRAIRSPAFTHAHSTAHLEWSRCPRSTAALEYAGADLERLSSS